MNLTPAGLDDLLATSFTLWFRASKRDPWAMHSQHLTELGAVCAMGDAGEWLVLPAGQEP